MEYKFRLLIINDYCILNQNIKETFAFLNFPFPKIQKKSQEEKNGYQILYIFLIGNLLILLYVKIIFKNNYFSIIVRAKSI